MNILGLSIHISDAEILLDFVEPSALLRLGNHGSNDSDLFLSGKDHFSALSKVSIEVPDE
jgi:hypothetical protein